MKGKKGFACVRGQGVIIFRVWWICFAVLGERFASSARARLILEKELCDPERETDDKVEGDCLEEEQRDMSKESQRASNARERKEKLFSPSMTPSNQ